MQTRIENPYGYYDINNQEYVITRPDTPTPWMNYLGQGNYGGIISNTAGGYSFDRDPRNRRITRYRYNSIPADQPGRYIYLRDQDTGDYWSPTVQPVPARQLKEYECRHGTAYTRIRSSYNGITSSILYFVPPEKSCELWVLHIKNNSKSVRRIRSFSYAEFSLLDAATDQTNLDWGAHIFHSRYADGIIYSSTQFRPSTTFFASNALPIGFDTDRDVFVGRLRDLSNPIVVEEGVPRQSEAPRGNNIGCLAHEWVLKPGQEIDLIYILGVSDDLDQIQVITHTFSHIEAVQDSFDSLCSDWDNFLGKFTVDTPDIELNAMINFLNAVQCRTTLYWSRFVSAYETGLGRGMGTRDSAQDTLAINHTDPEHARQTLSMLWHLQFKEGYTWHQVFPLTGEGGEGLAAEFPNWPQWFSDDHLWLVIATCAYLRETGDILFLDETISYCDEPDHKASVWEHMVQAVEFTLSHRGPRGLPRLGFADWDDTMNLDHGSGKAESVWTAEQFCRTLLDMSELCEYLGKISESTRFSNLHHEMAGIIQEQAWSGEWYLRAFDDEGNPVGNPDSQFHKIALNPQTWAVIGEIGQNERLEQAMLQAHQKLNTPFGLAILWPSYSQYDFKIQGTTTYPPGAKENGGIFCHANTWAVIAAAMLGWSDLAYQYYRQIMPLTRTDADHYAVEPYVYCGNLCGPEHPQFGRGRNAWLSGTASWMYVAGTQYILGIKPTYTGLRFVPKIPEDWDGFSAKRIFRGTTYYIDAKRFGPGNQARIFINGVPVEGDLIKIPIDPIPTVQVEIQIGRGS